MPNFTQSILAVMEDLMFMVRIQEAGKRGGFQTTVVKTSVDALKKAAERPALIILDLNYDAGEPLQLIRLLKEDPATSSIHLLAFVSHVQTELRAAALAAGCDTVLARSAFVQNLPELLTRLVYPAG